MLISFAKTQEQMQIGAKTVTRRRWAERTARQFKAGTIHVATTDLPYRSGADTICFIRATRDAYQQLLGEMPASHLQREGGLWATVDDFIMFIEGRPDEIVWVAEFESVQASSLYVWHKLLEVTASVKRLLHRDQVTRLKQDGLALQQMGEFSWLVTEYAGLPCYGGIEVAWKGLHYWPLRDLVFDQDPSRLRRNNE